MLLIFSAPKEGAFLLDCGKVHLGYMNGLLIAFVMAEKGVREAKGKEMVQIQQLKSAPHYFEASVPRQYLVREEKLVIAGREGELRLKIYKPNILLIEARFEIPDIFSSEVDKFKEDVLSVCYEYLKKEGAKNVDNFSEEYSVAAVSGYKGDPEQFFTHKEKIAGFLKSETLPLDSLEVDYTLKSQLKYAKNDLVIVDWDGAFVFDPDGDFASTLELLELANFQLLQYRILAAELDARLARVVRMVQQSSPKARFLFRGKEVHEALKDTILIRSRSVLEFENIDKEIKLIGDWYSARLYDLLAKKFKLETWHDEIREKIDAIEDIYEVASENFTITWERRSHIVEIFAWYMLLVGWFALLILETYFYVQK